MEREEARAREERRRREDEARQADIADVVMIIEAWNARLAAGRRVLFSPTIGAAIAAGYRWLTIYCPGCQTLSDVDLVTLDRHPDASIMSLIPQLSCRTCRPHPPFAQLKGLATARENRRRSAQ